MVILVSVAVLLLLMKLCQLLFCHFCLKKLTIQFELNCLRVQQGEKLELLIKADNHQWLILPGITFRITIPEKCKIDEDLPLDDSSSTHSQTFTLFASLFSYQKITKRIPLVALERGYCEIHVEVEVNSLLNRVTIPITPLAPLALIIHPQPMQLEDIVVKSCGLQGNEVVRRWIHRDPLFYTGVRPYQPQDNFKDIDWKASARMNELHVKEYDALSQPSYAIFLLVQPYDTLFSDSFVFLEKAVRFCTTLLMTAKQNQIDCSLVTNGVIKMTTADTSTSDCSMNHLISCLDVLAGVTVYPFIPMEKCLLRSLPRLFGQQQVFLIAHHFHESFYQVISNLVSRHIPVCLVLEEMDFSLTLPQVEIILLPVEQGEER